MFISEFIRQFWSLSIIAFKNLLRTPSAWIFGLIFPVVFIILFGFIGNNNNIKLNIEIVKDDSIIYQVIKTSLNKNPVFVVKESDNLENSQNRLKNGELDAVIYIYTENQIIYYTNFSRNEANQIITNSLEKINQELTYQKYNIKKPFLILKNESITNYSTNYLDYVLPGILGYTIMSSAVFGVAYSFLELRQNSVLKRLFSAPTNKLAFLLSQSSSRLIFIFVQILVLISIAYIFFNFSPKNGFLGLLEILVVVLIGLLSFLGLGYVVAGVSKNNDVATPLANLIVLPQFILSGTFFPTSILPSWLDFIVSKLPLYYFNEAVRKISIEGLNIYNSIVFLNLLYLIIWGGAFYIISSKIFKVT